MVEEEKQEESDPTSASSLSADDNSEEKQQELRQEKLKLLLANPFNKFCLDCKRTKSSYGFSWAGAFVCQTCS